MYALFYYIGFTIICIILAVFVYKVAPEYDLAEGQPGVPLGMAFILGGALAIGIIIPIGIHDAHGHGSMGLDARLSQVISSICLVYAALRGLLILQALLLIAIPIAIVAVLFEYILFGKSELLGWLLGF